VGLPLVLVVLPRDVVVALAGEVVEGLPEVVLPPVVVVDAEEAAVVPPVVLVDEVA